MQYKRHANLSPVSSDSIADGRIPASGVHHALLLEFLNSSGNPVSVSDIISEIDKVVVRVDGDVIIEASPNFLFARQNYYGASVGGYNIAGVLPIFYRRPHLPTEQSRSVYALGMANKNSYTVKVECGTLSNVATIGVQSYVENANRNMGQHLRVEQYNQSFSTTGDQEVSSLPFQNPAIAYNCLHINDGNINEYTVQTSKEGVSNNIFDELPVNLAQVIQERARRSPQAGFTHIDFGLGNEINAYLSMKAVQDFRFTLNWESAPSGYVLYAERVYNLNA